MIHQLTLTQTNIPRAFFISLLIYLFGLMQVCGKCVFKGLITSLTSTTAGIPKPSPVATCSVLYCCFFPTLHTSPRSPGDPGKTMLTHSDSFFFLQNKVKEVKLKTMYGSVKTVLQ